MSTEEDTYEDYDIIPMTPGLQIPSAIGIAILMILAIGGNIMTLVAYVIDKKLHTVYNFYIFNLAVADLLISCISMPFYAVYTLTGFTWPFGTVFCKIWLTVDFTACFETILIMLILSFDRLLLLTLGPLYQAKITKKVAAIEVSISWVVSFLIYGPAIISWNIWTGYSTVDEMDCDTEFANHFGYTTGTAIVEFVIPFCCMSFVNALIYYKIRARRRVTPEVSNTIEEPEPQGTSLYITNDLDADTQKDQQVGTSNISTFNRTISKEIALHLQPISQQHEGKINRINQLKSKTPQAQQNKKAARLLAFLVLIFLVCWAPYSITTIINSFCEDCVSTSLFEAFVWILWMKSALNPALYAYSSMQYRNHFKRFLTCVCLKKNTHNMNNQIYMSRTQIVQPPSK